MQHDICPFLRIYGVNVEWRHIPAGLRRRYERARSAGHDQELRKAGDDIFIEEVLRRAFAA